MGSKSKSSSETTTQDNKFEVGAEGIGIGAGNQGSINIQNTSRDAMQAASAIAQEALFTVQKTTGQAFDFGTNTVDRSLNTVDNTTEVAFDNVYKVIEETGQNITDLIEGARESNDRSAQTISALADNYGQNLRVLKANEQLGSVTQVTDIVKYVAIAAALSFVAIAFIRKGK